jgi:hypothetical protein
VGIGSAILSVEVFCVLGSDEADDTCKGVMAAVLFSAMGVIPKKNEIKEI